MSIAILFRVVLLSLIIGVIGYVIGRWVYVLLKKFKRVENKAFDKFNDKMNPDEEDDDDDTYF